MDVKVENNFMAPFHHMKAWKYCRRVMIRSQHFSIALHSQEIRDFPEEMNHSIAIVLVI